MIRNFYVYIYFDTRKPGTYNFVNYSFDLEPIYVGKGQYGSKNRLGRCIRHLTGYILEHDSNKLKTNKIKKIIKETGSNPKYIIFKENLTDEEAIAIEIDLIKSIGRIDKKTGTLCNLTDGGDTSNLSEETRNKIRLSKIGISRSETTKEKLRIANLGKSASRATRLKMSLNANRKYWKGRKLPEYMIKALSESAKKRVSIKNSNSQWIYSAISPSGECHYQIDDLDKFIIDNGVS